ncbi:hypothetical protein ACHAXA_002643 [Cyclostephanos tholiformis]|uniref:Conserved oligomeric Golgi complex subunit 3 C-terminal domain-containing protein n=1 Tax=Cyclostephanos tholiformis TaxID=382380 RepID=A0ABD3SDD2_9STRA
MNSSYSSTSSSRPLPPPPKISGLATPSNAASSFVYGTPSSSSSSSSSSASRGGTSGTSIPPPPSSTGKQRQSSLTSGSSSSSYEAYAPRTAEQRARLARIAVLTATPPPPRAERTTPSGDVVPPGLAPPTATIRFSLTDAMCPPKKARGNHHDDVDFDPAVSIALDSASVRASDLSSLVRRTASLRLALRASINIADDVSRRHAELLLHSGELSAAAERLQHEEALLSRRADEIGMPLMHYDAVDRLGGLLGVHFKDGGKVVVRGTARLHVDDADEYARVLGQIDDAVEFFAGGTTVGAGRGRDFEGGSRRDGGRTLESTSSSGAAEYYRRACAIQDTAVELLRVGVADRITQTSQQVQDALNLPRMPVASDKLEASLVYTRFHGISSRSNTLISIARRRLDALGSSSVASSCYEDLLTLCRNAYCGARETLLTSTVRHHMDALRERHGLVGMTRLASVFLIRLCTVETELYLDFFGDPEKRRHPRSRIRGALSSDVIEEEKEEEGKDLGVGRVGEEKERGMEDAERGPNSQQFRRLGSSSSHPGAAALASQVLSEDSTYRDAEFQNMLGSLCLALHRTIRRGLVSVLDLDVLCQVVSVLREERSAANSSPTTLAAAKALSGVIQDAQERLIFCANDALHKEVSRFKPSASDLNYPGKLLGEKPKDAIIVDNDAEKAMGNADEAKASPPPADDAVAAQLRVYQSWFPPMRSVLRILSKIFRVVEPRVFEDIALQSVQSCTKSLKDGSAHILRKSGQIHADLFLVKHLLILREQLSPFDIQLRSVERQLDFSEAGKAVTRFLANRNRRLFSMSTENALITLLREGVSVQESSVDSKRDLEDCLRSACNDFIEHTSSSLLGPIAVFVDQCKNTIGSTTGSMEGLAKAPFMNSTLVRSVFLRALQNLDEELDNVSRLMTLYLENTATQVILLKPVVRKMTRTLEEVKRFIREVPDEENGWTSDVRDEVMKSLEDFEFRVKMASSKK